MCHQLYAGVNNFPSSLFHHSVREGKRTIFYRKVAKRRHARVVLFPDPSFARESVHDAKNSTESMQVRLCLCSSQPQA